MPAATDSSADPKCQLQSYIEANGADIALRGKSYRFDNVRIEVGLGGFADAHTVRAKYLAMQTRGTVIGRPGAEPWVIMRTSGGGAVLAKFALYQGKILELA
ncbi:MULTISPECIES: hypothetical protein [Pseudomonas]|uniref:hypothetical protein n=1 Tax=Pseudomonas TaxID=286 RepID=UPI000C3460B8|nr:MULTISPECIES: hypothetical protein [Pseudomonas]PWC98743.1 hypothetical protein CX658_32120 [Pseudomonas amygdali pv. lachrymans]PWC98793.1 hypothetical protein CX658_31765 [Pseudomonas amygdali pv. lachrymans]WNZ87298.1 hypothetical protein QOM10_30575 [Pseudomonas sp. P108]